MAMGGKQLPDLENDGKQVVVISPATKGWKTWFTGAGDNLSPVSRGDGPKLRLNMVGGGDTQEVEIQFSEPVEVHDGGMFIRDPDAWDLDDSMDVFVTIPANDPSASPGTGNCNLVDSGNGFNILVPAAGDGSHSIPLGSATPVMVEDEKKPDGFWDVNRETGVVSAAAVPGKGNCNLLDVSKAGYLVNSFPVASPTGVIDIDVYKVEWVHQNYIVTMSVTKESVGAGKVAVWLLCFRKKIER